MRESRLGRLEVMKDTSWNERNRILSQFVQTYFDKSSISILEAGCGRRWHLDLKDIPYKLTGVDLCKDAIEVRQDLDEAVVGDLRSVEFEHEQFDIVYCVDVIEHVEGAERVIDKFFRWLKPKGILILVFPNRESVFGYITRMTPHCFHVWFYRYIVGWSNAGKPGFGPFPTSYDQIVSRRSIHAYCEKNNHSIALERGRSYANRFGVFSRPVQIVLNAMHYLSLGRLASDHSGLVYVLQKGSNT